MLLPRVIILYTVKTRPLICLRCTANVPLGEKDHLNRLSRIQYVWSSLGLVCVEMMSPVRVTTKRLNSRGS